MSPAPRDGRGSAAGPRSSASEAPGAGSGPLRIAVLARELPKVSETFVTDPIDRLRELGHEVSVFSIYQGAGPEDTGTPRPPARYLIGPRLPAGTKWLRAGTRALRALAHPARLGRLLSARPTPLHVAGEAIHAVPVLAGAPAGYDVVHAHFGPTGLLALALRRTGLLTGPLVTTFHGVDLTAYPGRHGDDVYRPLFAAGDAFTVNSGFSRDRALALGAPPERVHRIPMGVDPDRLPFRPRTRAPSEPLRLLSVGRLEPVKGLAFGLRAVARLRGEGFDVRYTIVGTGRLEAELREDAARLGIDEAVRFTGPLPFDRVIEEYDRHHIFLMPGVVAGDGQVEAQGRVLVEAQAAGMPVVASRVGGIPETLVDGAGILVPPRDPEALAAAVRELAAESERWPEMGERGRRHVEEHYDASRLVDALIDVYRSAMRTARGTP